MPFELQYIRNGRLRRPVFFEKNMVHRPDSGYSYSRYDFSCTCCVHTSVRINAQQAAVSRRTCTECEGTLRRCLAGATTFRTRWLGLVVAVPRRWVPRIWQPGSVRSICRMRRCECLCCTVVLAVRARTSYCGCSTRSTCTTCVVPCINSKDTMTPVRQCLLLVTRAYWCVCYVRMNMVCGAQYPGN